MKISLSFLKQSKLGSDADGDWSFLVTFFFVLLVAVFMFGGFEYYRVVNMKTDNPNFVPSEQEFVKKQALQSTLKKYEERKLKSESIGEKGVIYIDPSL